MKEKFNEFMQSKFLPVAGRISQQRHLVALRDSFMITMPLVIIGSIFLLIANFPIPGYADFMQGIFGDSWSKYLSMPFDVTIAIMALFNCFALSYSLAKEYKITGAVTGVLSVAVFMLMTPFEINFTPAGSTTSFVVSGIPTNWMGSQGMFVAIICAFAVTELYRVLSTKKVLTIKMPDSVPPSVYESFASLIPAFIIITIFWLIRIGFSITPYGSLNQFIYSTLQVPLSNLGTTLPALMLIVILQQIFWFFGLHGALIVSSVVNVVFTPLSLENLEAFQAGEPLPHMFNQQTLDLFMNGLGGSGALITIILAMILVAKSKRLKSISKLSLVPDLFNIGEPILFGTPLVLNPMMLVPLIVTPALVMFSTWLFTVIGFLPPPSGVMLPWTTPPIISGFLVSGWQGAFVQGFNIVMGILINIPFIKMLDKQYLKEEIEEK